MRRRDFLGRVAVGTLGLAMGSWPRRASAAWGDYPAELARLALPESRRARNVLEIFLYGGISPWETFYVVPEFGRPDDREHPNQQWWTFQEGSDGVPALYAECFGASGELLQPFGVDEAGRTVNLGPFTDPLRTRADILARLRMHVLRHAELAHEVAVPLAVAGLLGTDRRLAGVGTAVQRHAIAHGWDEEPASYVLFNSGPVPAEFFYSSVATGLHPGSMRPVSLRIAQDLPLAGQFRRETLGDRAGAHDALLAHYADRYGRRLTHRATGEAVRSVRFEEYRSTLGALAGVERLERIFDGPLLAPASGVVCAEPQEFQPTLTALRAAVHLLRRPESRARHVSIFDLGATGQGYDTHNSHIRKSAILLSGFFRALVSVINEPGEGDPEKLDLDETLVVLNTEFGRAPVPELAPRDGTGLNHHPYGYCTVMFGGPVGADQRGIVGAIGPDALATSYLHPADTRAAILTALGIYPFAADSYRPADLQQDEDEDEALERLRSRVLGAPT